MTTTGHITPMIIGRERRTASDGAVIESVDPATGRVNAAFPAATAADVDDAVQAAHTAFTQWRRTTPEERAALLYAFAQAVEDHGEELARLDVADNGSPIKEMRNDVRIATAQLRYFAGLTLQARGDTVPTGWGRLNYSLRQPYGVVARIIPFNHPLMFAAAKMAAPLAAGNTVIVKPSEHTSLSALRLGELAAEIFPAGVVSIVTGHGATAGDALVRHPLVRRLAFIGAADTGRAIQRAAAEAAVKHITLELGGKNPIVVFPDADLDTAVDAAVRGMNFTWQGQSCGSTSRLLVQHDRYDEFVAALGERVAALKSGLPDDEHTDTGAIVNRIQYEKVTRYIDIGRSEGATVVCGGGAPEGPDFAHGTFVRPTVFAGVDPYSRLAQEEIFGPVLAAIPFTDYDEALTIANSVRYGLTASVFTTSLQTAHRFARDVEAGYVWVNDVSRHVPGTSFGGTKDSGLGREEDLEELLSYTEPKNVHVNFG
ncbi:2-formylbenzoate dehydrogenase (plasmid) [Streptomyces sp. enrichment culture]|uniref:aldehyde dehydrogenase family protein n=1 Tax=Streptomyces sp. enrichment culture TaxID=1795815 RepID=UPI003F569AF8